MIRQCPNILVVELLVYYNDILLLKCWPRLLFDDTTYRKVIYYAAVCYKELVIQQ